MTDFTGRVALVTGAASGIGAADVGAACAATVGVFGGPARSSGTSPPGSRPAGRPAEPDELAGPAVLPAGPDAS